MKQSPDFYIPSNARAMEKVKLEDAVLITIEGDPLWALFGGANKIKEGEDCFLIQDKARDSSRSEDEESVSLYIQRREFHKYDNQRGVLLDDNYTRIRSKPTDEGYSAKVDKLKRVGLWQENNQVAGVKA